MEVILLERVEKLGAIGDVVGVKNGYARNFLIPQGKALLATERNKRRFEAEREQIEARNAEARTAAKSEGEQVDGSTYVLIRQSGDTGQLYGSVSARDICEAAQAAGHALQKSQIQLNQPIKTIGVHEVSVRLHAEVSVTVTINVARSEDEAERQAAGENVIEAAFAADRAEADEAAAEIAEAAAEAAAERGPAEE
ncbi:MAG: 50S ribosomal protein L9 [Pseudomonadota bacterium]